MRNPYRAAATAAGLVGAAMLLLGAGETPNVDPPAADPAAYSFSTADAAALSVSATDAAVAAPIAPPVAPVVAPEPDPGFVLPESDTLSEMVAKVRAADAPPLDREARCLASTVYYESKGEPLAGQLAVAQVVLNRVANGRFGGDICAVVTAPKQFGFVKGGRYAAPGKNPQWTTAKAIALIALGNGWPEIAPEATHFHATWVNPRWNLRQVATIGGHIFYR